MIQKIEDTQSQLKCGTLDGEIAAKIDVDLLQAVAPNCISSERSGVITGSLLKSIAISFVMKFLPPKSYSAIARERNGILTEKPLPSSLKNVDLSPILPFLFCRVLIFGI